ncbi:hypothetical protein ANCCEY_12848 [Ancylostoma ceylanicum]|uniref:Reverse transcriptase domain-containing protein n=1 Tax=Ancylostoma ceylanicum TaxID=53326 RepID=A0A0D6L8B5_9BILA|nr:hypothetical protein ANCCEY_12848 [Ancylostoma ceylanicum]
MATTVSASVKHYDYEAKLNRMQRRALRFTWHRLQTRNGGKRVENVFEEVFDRLVRALPCVRDMFTTRMFLCAMARNETASLRDHAKNLTAPGLGRIRLEHLKNLLPVPISTSEVYKLLMRVILDRVERTLGEGQLWKQTGATLEAVTRKMECDNMRERVDVQRLLDLHFADDIVFIAQPISQAERMLADFDNACGKMSL